MSARSYVAIYRVQYNNTLFTWGMRMYDLQTELRNCLQLSVLKWILSCCVQYIVEASVDCDFI